MSQPVSGAGAPLRVLLVEDSPADAELLTRELRRSLPDCLTARVQTAGDLAAALREFAPDIVLSDHSLPQFSARDALALIHRERPTTPVIVVTGSLDEETAAEYIKAGAVDYVVKDRLHRLVPAVTRALALRHALIEQADAEEAERRVTDHMRALIDASPLAIISLDTAGVVTSWSAAAERIFGWSAAEVVGRPLPYVPESDREEFRRQSGEVLGGATMPGTEVTRLHKDGRLIQLSLSAGPVFDAGGSVTGIMAVAADVTEVRKLEAQYRQSQKMEAIGRLAGGVAHDFNNLLAVIMVYAELVRDGLPASHALIADLGEILRATEQARSLTQQLLAFSRQQVIQQVVIDPRAAIAGMEQMLARVLGRSVELRCELAPSAGLVRVDPGQMEQIVMNLAVNARDAMPSGGRLTVRASGDELDEAGAKVLGLARAGRYIVIEVSDTGTGMSAETQARIFEPFYTTKAAGKGTGLGLATVYAIVTQNGGHVTVQSELGRGTTFRCWLPRVPDTMAVAVPAPAEAPARPGSGETILLAEDDAGVRAATTQLLERLGYRVLAAPGAEEALALAGRHQGALGLVITDVVMPRMDGPALVARLRSGRPDLKVLFMSGHAGDAEEDRGVPRGMPFLEKPFTIAALACKVREVLDRTEGAVRVLFVGEDAAQYEKLSGALAALRAPAYTLDWCATYDDGLRAMERGDYDAHLVSERLLDEDRNGFDLVRAAANQRPIAAVLLCESGDQCAAKAADSGASACLPRSQATAATLHEAICGAMR